MLKAAEQRLRTTRATAHTVKEDAAMSVSLPSIHNSSTSEATGNFPTSSYIKSTSKGAHIESRHLVTPQERKLANGLRRVEDPIMTRTVEAQSKKATAGSDWYDLPRTNLTPELKRDLQLLRMRSVLDPKRHYKKDNSNKVPEFSQVGTVIEGPTEFFSARLSNKERKRTFVDEVLTGETATQRFKSKYGDIQSAMTSGKKAHYKSMKAKRAHKPRT